MRVATEPEEVGSAGEIAGANALQIGAKTGKGIIGRPTVRGIRLEGL